MNYELAKSLKDAGFPQGTTEDANRHRHIDKDGNPCGPFGRGAAYIPILSELIEACGGGFDEVGRSYGGGWRASQGWDGDGGYYQPEYGSTPEEAVARLWLALNKKP